MPTPRTATSRSDNAFSPSLACGSLRAALRAGQSLRSPTACCARRYAPLAAGRHFHTTYSLVSSSYSVPSTSSISWPTRAIARVPGTPVQHHHLPRARATARSRRARRTPRRNAPARVGCPSLPEPAAGRRAALLEGSPSARRLRQKAFSRGKTRSAPVQRVPEIRGCVVEGNTVMAGTRFFVDMGASPHSPSLAAVSIVREAAGVELPAGGAGALARSRSARHL